MPGAVRPFERLEGAKHCAGRGRGAGGKLRFDNHGSAARRQPTTSAEKETAPKSDDLLFPKTHRDLFNIILDEEGLKLDREGRPRTAYSLRHTYICLRLMEGADITRSPRTAAPASR